MTTQHETLIPQIDRTDLAKRIQAVQTAAALVEPPNVAFAGNFQTFYTRIHALRQSTSAITDPQNPIHQDMARTIRLGLREVRCEIEALRKSLKEKSLREGKAVDGYANILKYLCEPVEEQLLAIEEHEKRRLAAEREQLIQLRATEILTAGGDPSAYNLGDMDEATYKGTLDYLVNQRRQAQERAAAEEAARIATEKARQEETTQLRTKLEIAERDRAAAEEAQRKAQAAADQAESERARANLAARAAQNRADTEQKARLRAEEEAAAEYKARLTAESKAAKQPPTAPAPPPATIPPTDAGKLNNFIGQLTTLTASPLLAGMTLPGARRLAKATQTALGKTLAKLCEYYETLKPTTP